MGHNEQIFKNEYFLLSHPPLKDLQNDGLKHEHDWAAEVDRVCKISSEKNRVKVSEGPKAKSPGNVASFLDNNNSDINDHNIAILCFIFVIKN